MQREEIEYFERILQDDSYAPGQGAMQVSQIGLGRFKGWHRMGMLIEQLQQAQDILTADAPPEQIIEYLKGSISWTLELAIMLERALAQHELMLDDEAELASHSQEWEAEQT